MVKGSIGPEHSIVAGLASGREARRNVVHGRRRLVVVTLVARHASCAGQVVIVIDVAIGTLPWRGSMRPGQRESSAVVVECRVQPGRSAVARFASLRKVRGNMVWIRRPLEILQMACNARSTTQVVVVVEVAVRALPRRHSVQAGERKPSSGMIKLAVRP